MCPAERIPRALAGKFAAITALTDAFCEQQVNDEYRVLIHRVVGSLPRKRPSLSMQANGAGKRGTRRDIAFAVTISPAFGLGAHGRAVISADW